MYMCAVVAPLLLLQIFLIAIQLRDVITLHWSIIFIPLYFLSFLFFILTILLFIQYSKTHVKLYKDLFFVLCLFFGIIALVTFLIFLSLQLSGTVNWDPAFYLSPLIIYFGLVSIWVAVYIIFKDWYKDNSHYNGSPIAYSSVHPMRGVVELHEVKIKTTK